MGLGRGSGLEGVCVCVCVCDMCVCVCEVCVCAEQESNVKLCSSIEDGRRRRWVGSRVQVNLLVALAVVEGGLESAVGLVAAVLVDSSELASG